MGGAVLMFIRSFAHLHVMLHSDRTHGLPVIRLSTLSASILASLLGLTLPASAQRMALGPAPPPSPQSQPTNPGDSFPPLTNEAPPAKNLPPGARSENGEQPAPKVSSQNAGAKEEAGRLEETTTKSKTDASAGSGKGKTTGSPIDNTTKNTSGNHLQSAQNEVLAASARWRWIPYGIAILIFLVLMWLSILTWLAYQGLATANRKSNKLQKKVLEMDIELEDLARNLGTQKTAQLQTQQLAHETAGRMAAYANSLSTLRADLAVQENRLFDIQAVQHTGTILKRECVLLEGPEMEQPVSISEPQLLDDPATSLTNEYQEAFFRGDRSALRRMMPDELNITQHSEDALMKTASLPTQLEIVKTGGSYLLIHREGRHLLVPDFQTLTSFTTNQLAKGIFSYERESVFTAELRLPAEVRDVGGLWEVVTMGVIAVPT
jgi:hypothetical protein